MIAFLYYFIFVFLLNCTAGFQPYCPQNSRYVSQYLSADSSSRLSSITTSETPSTNDNSIGESSITSESASSNEIKVDYQAYGNGYKTVFSELPFAECKASSGSIPTDLKGSYFRCGPGE